MIQFSLADTVERNSTGLPGKEIGVVHKLLDAAAVLVVKANNC